LDGSKRSAPWLGDAQTYSGALGQQAFRFIAAAAALSMGACIVFGDTDNAFQQSPPLTKKCYLEPDEAYKSWYQKRFGKALNWDEYVLPINRALQGHPEAGLLWQKMIVPILMDLGLKPLAHEPSVYVGSFQDTRSS